MRVILFSVTKVKRRSKTCIEITPLSVNAQMEDIHPKCLLPICPVTVSEPFLRHLEEGGWPQLKMCQRSS